MPSPCPIAVRIPFDLPLKIALFITTTILGPGEIAPNRHTKIICEYKTTVIVIQKNLLLFGICLT